MLKNKHLSKAISDVGMYEFRRQLEYKTKWYGSEIVYADRFFPSTKRCSRCGHINSEMKLSQRIFVCESCGFTADRDYNSSLNLQQTAIAAVSSPVALKTPVGEGSSGFLSNEDVKLPSMNQESNIEPELGFSKF
ncbi:MAG: Putative transposase DNA-binding domain protein [Candidatus Methanolliviera sp. GoM_oil]|nr:MAG: Putative transposase DNA-binding domain protein [Candidatus Methanolliviera sp. GoM_oil]